MPSESPAQKRKIEKVMHEYKEGDLHSGGSGKKVKSRKQAVAIALSEAGASKPPSKRPSVQAKKANEKKKKSSSKSSSKKSSKK